MTLIILHEKCRYESRAAVSDDDLRERVERLLAVNAIIRADGEVIRRCEDIYDAEFQPNIKLWQFLFEADQKIFPRDIAFQLQLALDQATSVQEAELASATLVGAIGPFDISNYHSVDTEKDWREVVREDLCIAPVTPTEFHDRCSIAFPRVCLSLEFPSCLDTFEGGQQRYTRQLVCCLAALNDEWDLPAGADLPERLRAFSAVCGFKTTLEGNGDRKIALSFKFRVDSNRTDTVLCEPHMKISGSDEAGDTTFRHHRIYFAPRPHESFGDRVLVGHAGKHL